MASRDKANSALQIEAIDGFLDLLQSDFKQLAVSQPASNDAPRRSINLTALTPRQFAILTYALKLTATPAEMEAGDVEALRAMDLTDTDILHIAEIIGYYAFVNRIADGLGVELESTP